jgi:hypothetical protein
MHSYQIYLRISRGGTGIPYELSKQEFLTVFRDFSPTVQRDWWASRRTWVDMELPPEEIASVAANLAYTEAILHLQCEPYAGEEFNPTECGRWFTGWVREGEKKVLQTEIYVQDAEGLLAESPDKRGFEVKQHGTTRLAVGHRSHRALSILDARYLLNIADPKPTDRILDPFAGYGGIVRETKRRKLDVVASDIDKSLSPGLAGLDPTIASVADARDLPLPREHFDLIITEPPFRSVYRQAVLASLPELRRVLKPDGRIVLLIAMDMCEAVQSIFERMNATVEIAGVIPRGGGLKCPALHISFPRHQPSTGS